MIVVVGVGNVVIKVVDIVEDRLEITMVLSLVVDDGLGSIVVDGGIDVGNDESDEEEKEEEEVVVDGVGVGVVDVVEVVELLVVDVGWPGGVVLGKAVKVSVWP